MCVTGNCMHSLSLCQLTCPSATVTTYQLPITTLPHHRHFSNHIYIYVYSCPCVHLASPCHAMPPLCLQRNPFCRHIRSLVKQCWKTCHTWPGWGQLVTSHMTSYNCTNTPNDRNESSVWILIVAKYSYISR